MIKAVERKLYQCFAFCVKGSYTMLMMIFLLIFLPDEADLHSTLLQNDCHVISSFLDDNERILIDIRPFVRERGSLPKAQAELVLCKLYARYKVESAEPVQSLFDTNYSWLIQQYHVTIVDRVTQTAFHAYISFRSSFYNGNRRINELKISGVY